MTKKIKHSDPKKIKRVEFADTHLIDQQPENVNKLVLMLAEVMSPEDTQGFIDYCFVSDESKLGDFHLTEKQIAALVQKLGFPVGHNDYIVTIAARMGGRLG